MTPEEIRLKQNPVLTGLLKAMSQGRYIATRVLPSFSQKLSSQLFGELGDEAMRRYNLVRAPGTNTKRVTINIKGKVYTIKQKSVEIPIARELLREADEMRALNVGAYPEVSQMAMSTISDILALDYELDAAELLSNTTSYPAGNVISLTGTALWSGDNSKPIDDIRDAREIIRKAAGVRPNMLTLGAAVYERLCRHPQIIAGLGANAVKIVTDDFLKQILGVAEIVVGDTVWVNEKNVTADVWGDMALLSYSPAVTPSTASAIDAPFGITSVMEGHPFSEKPYWEDQTKSWIFGGTYERLPNLLKPAAGVLFDKPLGT